MRRSTSLFLLALVTEVFTMPQFITFENGKLGVNFGGYHAGVGIGGLLGGTGTAGGLYAEAGTPNGQSARAGLGGSVDEKGGASGGLFAGATAGGNVRAAAGLAGGVNSAKTAGGGFASAQAGDRIASSGLAGETSVQGSAGILHSSTSDVQPTEVKSIHKNIEANFNIDSANEIKPEFVALSDKTSEIQTNVQVKGEVQPTVVKEVSKVWRPNDYYYHKSIYPTFNFQDLMNSVFDVRPRTGYSYNRRPWTTPQRTYNPRTYKVYVETQPQVVEKHIIHKHYKPRRQHFRKTAYIGGYIGGGGDVAPPAVYKTEPAIQKRVDVGVEANANAGASVGTDHDGGLVYRKEIKHQRGPTFFEDIFNIPISTLRAVGNFLSNTAVNTNVSVQKTASVQAENSEAAKHDISSLSDTHISVKTPSASQIIDDIFAIPINTLGAVNKFLGNNVGRRSAQGQEDGEPTQVRLGHHARRRSYKQVVVAEAPKDEATA